MSDWIGIEEAAEYLGISTSNLYSLVQQSRVPGSKLGRIWRFNRVDLDIWIRANKPLNEFFNNAEVDIENNHLIRDPQKEGYLATYNFFSAGGREAIVQLPVGCGKTGLISILPFGIARGRVLVIAPNLTIREELKKNLDITNKRHCFWYKCAVLAPEALTAGPFIAILDGKDANIHDCDQSHIVITNIQQLASSADRWLPNFPDNFFDLILVDEGHHSAAQSWKKVFERFPNAKVVNLTATPFRSDNQDISGELVYRYSFVRAMIKGYIKKLQAIYVAPQEIYFTYQGDKRHHTLAEVLELKEEEWFSRGVALAEECNRNIVDTSLDKLEYLRQTGTRHQLIAVACSVAHAKQIRALYAERGYEAAEIHSNMNEVQKNEVLQKLRAGILDCIIQVQMLGEGFDHPHLSVAAIFRPFRSLSPYVQFVGRIMRVVVQNDSRHPDNTGYVVSHIGMNLDRQWADFRELSREDKEFFNDLISGKEPEIPREVLEGNARQKLSPEMVVHREIIEELFEEDYLQTDDEELLEELKTKAEALGFDSEKLVELLKSQKKESTRSRKAPMPFPVIPQLRRKEIRKRLQEEEKRAAKALLNRFKLNYGGNELAFKYKVGITGSNFVVAVQLIHHEVNSLLGINGSQRSMLKTEEYEKGIEGLDEILNKLTKKFKRKEKANE
ncbi:MAG TPA: DEAD/DEAH box helicase family protein [Syntrophales bacterium]|nr:DEAD/DEAH box helicase family protein [Syntrophales bacterium]